MNNQYTIKKLNLDISKCHILESEDDELLGDPIVKRAKDSSKPSI